MEGDAHPGDRVDQIALGAHVTDRDPEARGEGVQLLAGEKAEECAFHLDREGSHAPERGRGAAAGAGWERGPEGQSEPSFQFAGSPRLDRYSAKRVSERPFPELPSSGLASGGANRNSESGSCLRNRSSASSRF